MDITSSIKKYKNSVTRKYISLSNDEIDVVTKGDYWFSRKYDGQLWFYCKSNKNSKIINSNENDISNLISEIKKDLDKKLSKIKNIILAGELYFLTKESSPNQCLEYFYQNQTNRIAKIPLLYSRMYLRDLILITSGHRWDKYFPEI